MPRQKKADKLGVLLREKSLLKHSFPFLDISIHAKARKLVATGEFQPTNKSGTYSYKIVYTPPESPSVYVMDPVIPYHDDIHMYPKDNSLCLYHKSDLIWDYKHHHLHQLIVPWTHEWFVFYELYQISGRWEHPFVPHRNGKEEI